MNDYVSYEQPPPPKRGRAYAPMGEFDLSLIREFRACSALYDRSSESFRDKLYTSHQWKEISNKLGYDVSLLKDRMLQLRNRYNLEKRRVEQLREENPGQHVDSPWPLFNHLHFLSEHIRPRRSYRSLIPRHSSHANDSGDDDDEQTPQPPRRTQPQRYAAIRRVRDSLSDDNDDDSPDNGCTIINSAEMTPFANGILTVKMEEVDGENAANASDIESGSQSGNENANNQRAHPLKLSAASTLLTNQKHQPHSIPLFNNKSAPLPTIAMKTRSLKYSASSAVPAPPAAIKIRRLDTMQERSVVAASAAAGGGVQSSQRQRTNIPDTNSHFNNTNNDNNSNNTRSIDRQNQDCTNPPSRMPAYNVQVNRRCLTNSEQKYAAFGDFVTASLLELPASRALQLVEKFTTEVVRVLLDSKTTESVQSQLQAQPFSHMNGGIGETINGV
ncbi:uncharacterized protein jigr1 isoform X2 [Eurosta solidaginis]